MERIILPDAIINNMTIMEINRHFRNKDESDMWPICGKFNVTERAIRRLRKLRKDGLDANGGLAYYLTLEEEISNIVNDERNW